MSAARDAWNAAEYESLPLPHVEWGRRTVAKLDLEGDEHVLEAGAGTGRDAELVLEHIPDGHYTALDGSAQMLDMLRQRLAPYGDRVTAIEADLTAPLPVDAPADVIFSVATFHWIADHDVLFANLAATLKPGGQLAFDCGGEGNVTVVDAAVEDVLGSVARPWNFRGAEQTRAALEATGFVDVDVRLRPHPVDLGDRAMLERFLDQVGMGVIATDMTADERAALVSAVADRMPAPQMDYVRLEATARKV